MKTVAVDGDGDGGGDGGDDDVVLMVVGGGTFRSWGALLVKSNPVKSEPSGQSQKNAVMSAKPVPPLLGMEATPGSVHSSTK
ncbi:hypothetical protein TWF718_003635 [Orbilia javanica]|uniref:Uncharacterized protein n=1 Tax=Orbilia javanica TaxID=47235 RepID=A0AAN8MWR1_9PEZI